MRGHIRARFETFDQDFRAAGGGEEHIFVTRTSLEMTVRDTYLSATTELLDSRVFSGVSDADLDTTIVNPLELLQAFIAGDFKDTFSSGDTLRVQLGRHTMDVGSRRLVARNRYRNTINAFTGLNTQWESADGTKVRGFYTLPVQRLPSDAASLDENQIEYDEERKSVRFYGVHAEIPKVAAGMNAEFYGFGLLESDAPRLNTRDRNIKTVGTRWQKPHAPGEFHWELESAYQFGESPSSESRTLDHEAWFHHAMLGYRFEAAGQPRVEALFDYVSGDKDPNDEENNRFDPLFGARRFDFGPTGILGAFARANLVSPGLRFVTKLTPKWDLILTHRLHYLASDRDAWTTAGIVDPSGGSGNHIGDFTEFSLRYEVVPKSLQLEFGAAYFAQGGFAEDAPNSPDQGDTLYGYIETTFSF